MEYEYLGSFVDYKGNPTKEIVRRTSAAYGIAAPLKPRFFNNKKVPFSVKAKVGTSLIMSRAFYCAQVWPLHAVGAERAAEQSLHKLYRIMHGAPLHSHRHKPDKLAADLAMLPAIGFLRVKRLLYMHRVLHKAPQSLRELIGSTYGQAGSWLKMIDKDLAWLHSFAPTSTELPHPDRITEWYALLGQIQASSWAAIIRKAARIAILRHQQRTTLREFHAQFVATTAEGAAQTVRLRDLQRATYHIPTAPAAQVPQAQGKKKGGTSMEYIAECASSTFIPGSVSSSICACETTCVSGLCYVSSHYSPR